MSRLSDLALMTIAIDEAKQVSSRDIYPNPRVGAAIRGINGDEFASFHAVPGEDHAEVRAIKLCKKNSLTLKGATIAVSLEPCSHHGKTPPCVDALIEAEFAKVIIATRDPFEKVAGKGIQKLKEAGIEVVLGVMDKEAEALNVEWLFAHRNKRPFVSLKMATSMDGKWKTKNGEDRWVTSDAARLDAHIFRSQVQAILTSSKTVDEDNPSMTARSKDESLYHHQPLPIVLTRDESFQVKANSKLAQHPRNYDVIKSDSLSKTLEELYSKDIFHVMLEAGPTLCQEFMVQDLADEIVLYLESNFYGESSYGFPASFNGGKLPGDVRRIKSCEKLSETSLKLILIREHI